MKNNHTMSKLMRNKTYKPKPMSIRREYNTMTYFQVQTQLLKRPWIEVAGEIIKRGVKKIMNWAQLFIDLVKAALGKPQYKYYYGSRKINKCRKGSNCK